MGLSTNSDHFSENTVEVGQVIDRNIPKPAEQVAGASTLVAPDRGNVGFMPIWLFVVGPSLYLAFLVILKQDSAANEL